MPGTVTGKHILYDATISVNGVALTTRLQKVTIMVGTNKQAGASMGEIQDYSIPGTLTVDDPTAEFFQDYNTAMVYATLYALWAARTTFNIVGKASSGATSATNPAFTVPVFVGAMPLLSGTRGDLHLAPVTFATAGELSVAVA